MLSINHWEIHSLKFTISRIQRCNISSFEIQVQIKRGAVIIYYLQESFQPQLTIVQLKLWDDFHKYIIFTIHSNVIADSEVAIIRRWCHSNVCKHPDKKTMNKFKHWDHRSKVEWEV